MTTLKSKLQEDLTAAIRGRDELRSSTLRLTLSAITKEEVSGKTARELSDDEVLVVLKREAKKRREAATAFGDAGRTELAAKERAEEEILATYLPAQLSDDELAATVREALAAAGLSGMSGIGPAMKAAQAAVAGRAEGGRVAAEVRRQLG